MDDQTDQRLLRDYAARRSEAAFAELVRRHVDFVYSAAVRMLGDAHLAEDVTQGVFLALAKNSRELADHPVLSGWLHRTTRNLAGQTVRTNVRRQAREQEAAAMNELLSAEPDAVWEHIAPQLDDALGELNEPDRDAIFLRYFGRKSAREMAQILGTTEDAAQRRVGRAVERLREVFAKRGVTVGAAGLAGAIATNGVQAAPAALAVSAVAASGASSAAATTMAKVVGITLVQKVLIGATLIAAVGTGIYEVRKASNLRDEVRVLQQQQAPLEEQVAQLTRERDEAAGEVIALRQQNEELNRNSAELVRLREEMSRTRGPVGRTAPGPTRGALPGLPRAQTALANPMPPITNQQPEPGAVVWTYAPIMQQNALTNLVHAMAALGSATNEFLRYIVLDQAAKTAFIFGKTNEARSYAEELLALDQKFTGEPWRGGAPVFYGNQVLGRIALQDGRVEDAKAYLLESGTTVGSPVLMSFGPDMALAKDLLERGEQDTVLEYFKLCEKFWKYDELKRWTEDVKAGRMPDFGGRTY